ncbi:acidic leucine-rich nuclear phosphoprotein 32 family member E-like, partial [Tigriopus californicus]|uniref:acidic leucine-rich nuclear phosphoprotein 32 family member E-like n=1 Tax=Tigriopus californicus TaxID=6832 RepID=UPI0027DA5975
MVSNLQIQRSPTAASHQAHPPPQVVSGEMGMGQNEAQDRSVVAALQDIKMALQSSKTTNPHDRHGMTALSATRIPPSSSEVVSDGLTDSWHSRSNGNRRGPPSSMDYSTSQEDEEEEVGSDELEDEDEDEEEEGDDIEERPEDIIEERVPTPKNAKDNEDDLDTDQETDRLLGQQYNDDKGYFDSK